MEALKRVRGESGEEYIWPAFDETGFTAIDHESQRVAEVSAMCRQHRVVVQAGGNAGVFPRKMAKIFERVYTFEPEPLNFKCLCLNVPELNVYKFNAALGYVIGCKEIELPSEFNSGSFRLNGKRGPIPVLAIDDFGLDCCDLIYLDVEGYELPALRGGASTIATFSPVVVVEDKGIGDSPHKWLKDFGYHLHAELGNDKVFVC